LRLLRATGLPRYARAALRKRFQRCATIPVVAAMRKRVRAWKINSRTDWVLEAQPLVAWDKADSIRISQMRCPATVGVIGSGCRKTLFGEFQQRNSSVSC